MSRKRPQCDTCCCYPLDIARGSERRGRRSNGTENDLKIAHSPLRNNVFNLFLEQSLLATTQQHQQRLLLLLHGLRTERTHRERERVRRQLTARSRERERERLVRQLSFLMCVLGAYAIAGPDERRETMVFSMGKTRQTRGEKKVCAVGSGRACGPGRSRTLILRV